MFYQYAAGPADKEGNRWVDHRGGILVSRSAARLFRENYGALARAVALEWLRATVSFNAGVPDVADRFLAAYGCRGCACGSLPGLAAAGRIYFYCGASPRPEDRMCIDHFLPAYYVGGAREWNLVLACQGCRRRKAGMLPPHERVDRLEDRNAERRGEGAPPIVLPGKATRIEAGVERHYGGQEERMPRRRDTAGSMPLAVIHNAARSTAVPQGRAPDGRLSARFHGLIRPAGLAPDCPCGSSPPHGTAGMRHPRSRQCRRCG